MVGPQPLLCVVTPCFNEAEIVLLFYDALKPVLQSLTGLDHCILFVDDGSGDGTLDKLSGLAARDPRVQVLSLSRNFGHQAALTAGLDAAQGDAVVVMDSDLQHPPALIPQMVKLWREGHDIVSAIRQTTADSTAFKRLTSGAFYWLVNKLSDTRIIPGAADFCLLSHQAHQALRRLPERHRFLRGLVSWIGYRRAFVMFEAPARPAGHSKYSTLKMLGLALDAIFSFSVVPIRLAAHLGLLAISLSLLYLAYILFCFFFRHDLVPGWTSIIFIVTFLGGVQLAFIGVLGEYIGRIFEEVKSRPLYMLKQQPPAPGPRTTALPDGNP
jgi:dolichol-phosphate mannosyltransferase